MIANQWYKHRFYGAAAEKLSGGHKRSRGEYESVDTDVLLKLGKFPTVWNLGIDSNGLTIMDYVALEVQSQSDTDANVVVDIPEYYIYQTYDDPDGAAAQEDVKKRGPFNQGVGFITSHDNVGTEQMHLDNVGTEQMHLDNVGTEQMHLAVCSDLNAPLFHSSLGPNMIWYHHDLGQPVSRPINLMASADFRTFVENARHILNRIEVHKPNVVKVYFKSLLDLKSKDSSALNQDSVAKVKDMFEALRKHQVEPENLFTLRTFFQTWNPSTEAQPSGAANFSLATPHFQIAAIINVDQMTEALVQLVQLPIALKKILGWLDAYEHAREHNKMQMGDYSARFVSVDGLFELDTYPYHLPASAEGNEHAADDAYHQIRIKLHKINKLEVDFINRLTMTLGIPEYINIRSQLPGIEDAYQQVKAAREYKLEIVK